ncbi:hypothetical protein G7085_03900 [Tessaracoccus sp. HDW20]|uniref:hypothetical protein n=1 Tax=Tessaracoccus coleopterorum TaxID=2714950 RepID=UPI0018D3A207|nr:hypothetical protein [Tessaracoccus coleopterorum]NHB84077.1 hypothetical protein [Tessaracoccus coleopterorum]
MGFILVVAVNVLRAVGDIFGSLPEIPVAQPSGGPGTQPAPVDPAPVDPAPVDPVGPEPGAVNPNLPPRQWNDLPPADSSDPDWMTLQQSVLYAQPVPVLEGCPAAEIATDMGDIERLAGANSSACRRRSSRCSRRSDTTPRTSPSTTTRAAASTPPAGT